LASRSSRAVIAHYLESEDSLSGNNEECFSNGRYACFFDLDIWRDYVTSAGFVEVGHYYRPPGLPPHKQPWLATVWRKG
jgi:hypothetical protein